MDSKCDLAHSNSIVYISHAHIVHLLKGDASSSCRRCELETVSLYKHYLYI